MMSATPARALVLGGGVSGLTCAIRLIECGWRVQLLARELAGPHAAWEARPLIVSAGAGAIWEYPPYQVEPAAQARRWALSSHADLARLAENSDATGVRIVRLHTMFRSSGGAASALAAEPDLDSLLPAFRDEDERGMFGSGYSYDAPLAYMPLYLQWLRGLAESRGLEIFDGLHLPSISSALSHVTEAPAVVVNTLGLGNRELGDAQTYPTRGVMVYVRAPELSSRDVYFDEEAELPTYLIPQADGVLACGGVVEPNGEERDASAAEVEGILERCTKMLPDLRGCEVVGSWAGVRPSRAGGIRLELDAHALGEAGVPVVHNYGHGGSGVICSWGCAREVAALSLGVAETAGVADELAARQARAASGQREGGLARIWPGAGPEPLPDDFFV